MAPNPIPYTKDVDKLISIFLKAEQNILEAIGYKRGRGLVDYSQVAALERVQTILQDLIDDSWEYVPAIVEKQYLWGKRHDSGYSRAATLTSYDYRLVARLTDNLMGEIISSASTAGQFVEGAYYGQEQVTIIFGRRRVDPYREATFQSLAETTATGEGLPAAQKRFLQIMEDKGIVGFVDARGATWNLRSYAEMATRTTARQATNLGLLNQDLEHDLYQVSAHNTTCDICAPLENRVVSKSGTSTIYPPITIIFGKVDPNGPDNLDNTWLNIHPNCLHVLYRYFPEDHPQYEVDRIIAHSDPELNPTSRRFITKKQMEVYRAKEAGRRKLLNDIKQFERYKIVLGDDMPKTFQTFQKHKLLNDDKYTSWKRLFRERNKLLNQ